MRWKNEELVVVFGATSAIAKEVTSQLATKGIKLVLVGRNQEKLERTASEAEKNGASDVKLITCDFSDRDQCERASVELLKIDQIDRLFFAQGVLYTEDSIATQLLDEMWEVNVRSIAFFVEKLIPQFEKRGMGQIAAISSIAAVRGKGRFLLYAVTKGALRSYLQGLRNRTYHSGIKVLEFAVGTVKTPMTSGMKGNFLWSTPTPVATKILAGMARSKDITYVPTRWYWIMKIIRLIPEGIFKRLSW